MHLTEEQVQRVLHGESRPAAVDEHMAACAECRERVESAGAEDAAIASLLATQDTEPPGLSADMVAAVARANRGGQAPVFRWAAVIVLALGIGGVLYALPGSPLRRWIQGAGDSASAATPGTGSVPDSTGPGGSGIALPHGDTLILTFISPPSRAVARVRVTDEDRVVVEAPAGAARFTAGARQLEINLLADSVVVEIGIPRQAPRIEILSGGRRILLKSGQQVTTAGPPGDTVWVLPLAP